MRRAWVQRSAAVAALGLFGLAAPAEADPTLLMFEQEWCEWCARWDQEIGGAYHKTEEGRRAPLERIDMDQPVPEDVELASLPRLTPTFVLVAEGREVGRIEGYAGEHFFYPMLNRLLDRLPADAAAVAEMEGDLHDETD